MHPSRGRSAWCLAALLLAPAALPAQQPQPAPQPAAPKRPLVQDVWETAYLDGFRVGFTHLTVEERATPAGGKVLHAGRDLSLTVRRGPDIARIQAVTGTDETPDGKVVGVFMRQGLAAQVTQEVIGVVKGNQLEVTAQGNQGNFKKLVPWNPAVIGTLGELRILKDRKPKPGDKFDYLIYEPIVNALVTIRVKAEAEEAVPLGPDRPKLLRLTAVPDEIGGVQLPSQILWVDGAFEVRRSATAMPGLGFLVVERSTAAEAQRPLNPNQLPDLMQRQSIQLAQRIAWPHAQNRITYHITMTNDKEPAKTFARDTRQEVRNAQGNSFDLVVTAVRQPPTVTTTAAADPGKEFTENNYFLTSADRLVKQHAAAAVGGETDPWKKALLVERWVHQNMKVQNFTEAMAPASEVARTLTGDCTEYSMLAAAMCKAAGVPARTAIGLVYVDDPRQPLLGFHMWTEVFVRGAWVGIDATLGQGSIGPAHLKITDASWHDTRSMTPLLPLMRVMIGRPTVTVVEVK
ncbi:MAG TPA: transglutaminase-like domain-containing protein [Gemmataceae bacterium]|jgi:hypothetical protein